ncbi:HAD family hydrolase [Streptomyces sp. NPDC093801]|uniref:HAD family hydrolase n=1 Tax=Streptomyces sp. NPDC093801 TaxID=3155203 RepID=UPI00344E97DB
MPDRIEGLLVDMNGLFRHWHNTGARQSERLAGLPPGTINHYAYHHPAYRAARVGILSDQEWAENVADRLADDFGPAVREHLGPWRADRGTRDDTMAELLEQIRRHMPVGVLSNSTDALPADLEHHHITFDHVFSSASLGVDKPSPHAFRTAADHMRIPTQHLAYFDDEPTFVHAASTTGLHAHHFTSPTRFTTQLHNLGLTLGSLA